MPPRRRAAAVAAADDDVPMREADADLGFDDERDGARAGALCLAPRVRSQLAQDFRAAAGGEEEGRSARGGDGCRDGVEATVAVIRSEGARAFTAGAVSVRVGGCARVVRVVRVVRFGGTCGRVPLCAQAGSLPALAPSLATLAAAHLHPRPLAHAAALPITAFFRRSTLAPSFITTASATGMHCPFAPSAMHPVHHWHQRVVGGGECRGHCAGAAVVACLMTSVRLDSARARPGRE